MTTPLPWNYFIPQANDLPAQSQAEIESNFTELNDAFGQDHIPFGNSIVNITNSNPAIITSPNHGLPSAGGVNVTVTNVQGIMTQTTPEGNVFTSIILWPISDNTYTITYIDANSFSIPVDTSDTTIYPPYYAVTGDFSSASINYGWHKLLSFPTPRPNDPNKALPITSVYPKAFQNFVNAWFQNGLSPLSAVGLTNLVSTNAAGFGFTTPWGWIVNIGIVVGSVTSLTAPSTPPRIYNFPIPFNNGIFAANATMGLVQPNLIYGNNPIWNVVGSSPPYTQFSIASASIGLINSKDQLGIWYFAIGH